MIRVLSPAQMRAAEEYTAGHTQTTLINLAENAAKKIADAANKRADGGGVLFFCGGGGNGGDGYAAAQILHETGVETACFKCGGKQSEMCAYFFKRYTGKVIRDFNMLKKYKNFTVIVDALLGMGFHGVLKGTYKTAAEYINDSQAFVISADIPSGLSAQSGIAAPVTVKAGQTLALGEYKFGHFYNDAPDFCGELTLCDIGITLPENGFAQIYELKDIKKFFPKRKSRSNKGDFGRCSLIAGSYEYSGAALLSAAALSALKLGSGYCNLCIPMSLYSVFAGKVPECTITLLNDKTGEIEFDKEMLKNICTVSQSICIGMGVKCSEDVYKSIEYILRNFKGILIIDADGLNALAKYGTDILMSKKCSVILTPHVKEFSRLSGFPVEEIIKLPVEKARYFSERYNVTVLLKSSVSTVTDGENTAINITGNPGLAKGGSGDVLSGICGGVAARGLCAFESAVCASYVLGFAADIALEKINEYSMTASDVTDSIAEAINKITT